MKKHCIIYLFSFFAIISCDRERHLQDITFVNNSNITVSFHCSEAYPDTSMSSVYLCCDGFQEPHTSCQSNRQNSWENYFDHNNAGILSFFVLDANVVENTNWDTIVKYHMDLKRYEYTVEDMNSLNWTITYP